MKVVSYVGTYELLGKNLRVFLKDGGKFYFKVTSCGPNYISGFDDESLNLHINIVDIDFVVGGC